MAQNNKDDNVPAIVICVRDLNCDLRIWIRVFDIDPGSSGSRGFLNRLECMCCGVDCGWGEGEEEPHAQIQCAK